MSDNADMIKSIFSEIKKTCNTKHDGKEDKEIFNQRVRTEYTNLITAHLEKEKSKIELTNYSDDLKAKRNDRTISDMRREVKAQESTVALKEFELKEIDRQIETARTNVGESSDE